MKKIFIYLAVIATMFSQGFAQYGETNYSKFLETFGVKAGVNISNLVANPADDKYSSTVNYPYLGLFTLTPIGKMFAFQGEFAYSVIGADYKLFQNSAPIAYPLGYINLAGLIRVYPLEELGVNLQAGLQYGYLIYAKSGDLDWLDNYKSSDFDILLGAGFETEFGLIIDVRYLMGLTNLLQYQNQYAYATLKNSAIQIQLGWIFQ